MSSGCGGFARDPAKVEDQVRLLARTLSRVVADHRVAPIRNQKSKIKILLTPEPDGEAAACKAARSGFDSHRRFFKASVGRRRRTIGARPRRVLGFRWASAFRDWVLDPATSHTGSTRLLTWRCGFDSRLTRPSAETDNCEPEGGGRPFDRPCNGWLWYG